MRSWDQLNLFMLKCLWINLHTHFYLTYKVQFDILWHLEAVFSLLEYFFPSCSIAYSSPVHYSIITGTVIMGQVWQQLRFKVHLSNWDLRYISMLGLCWLILAQNWKKNILSVQIRILLYTTKLGAFPLCLISFCLIPFCQTKCEKVSLGLKHWSIYTCYHIGC